MKICPGCHKSIQDNSPMCPYCLYAFEVKKPASAQASKPEPAPQLRSVKSRRKPKPKTLSQPDFPSDVLGDQPITDPELYSQMVEGKRKKARKKWIVIIVILVFLAGMEYVAFTVKLGEEHDKSSMAESPSPAINEEPQKTASPSPVAEMEEEVFQQREYVIADSDSRYLLEEDLEGLSPEERRLARNEIYARHHRLFDDEGLQDYFNNCSWYEGKVLPEEFTEAYAANVFNEYELYNKDFILEYEKKHE